MMVVRKRTVMVDRDNLLELADALESGRYSQTVGTLRNGNSFCCLGVACDISGLGEWVFRNGCWNYVVSTPTEQDLDKVESSFGSLPAPVMEYYGLTQEGKFRIPGQDEYSLMGLNDNSKKSFSEIADFLRNPEIIWINPRL